MKLHIQILIAACFFRLASFAFASTPVDVKIDFENELVSGGVLEFSDGSASFNGNALFDGVPSSTFSIKDVSGNLLVDVQVESLVGDINVTGSGLQDGSSGYNSTGEGTRFTFSQDVIITGLDWSSFTSADSVKVIAEGNDLGVFTDDTVTVDADFSNTNAVAAQIYIVAGQTLVFEYIAGAFYLGDIEFQIVPASGKGSLILISSL